MDRLSGSFGVLVFVFVGFATNLVLDIAFDLPTAARWGVALVVMLLFTAAATTNRRGGARRRADSERGRD